ncbi:MAG: purine-nucleoside phosphorylase [Oscillospiraceae bacterium]|nr:purine-nucleoside phosphorylase [Oscillospiraceae bacterium]MCL2280018.1 purine-nucleoside phosphorylase [Oscillospiraceae bacterium]
MSTPHNNAKKGEIAKTVLMPGDPLRAKFIAEKYLDNAVQFNNIRGMLGFTGTYKGKPVSAMGSGMGVPSIGLYSFELFTHYDVENIIRVGSSGGYSEELDLRDIVLVEEAYSESSYARYQSGFEGDMLAASETLTTKLKESANKLGTKITAGRVHTSDIFYRTIKEQPEYWKKVRDEKNCLSVEMEAFGLFHNANITGKNAACILTISDVLFDLGREVPIEERENRFTAMMEIALGVL